MSSSKRYEATQRKMRRARQDGDVAKSPLLQGGIILAFSGLEIHYNLRNNNSLDALARDVWGQAQDFSTKSMLVYPANAVEVLGEILGPILACVLFVALIAAVSQAGVCFSFKPLAFKWSRLNPVSNLRRMFGADGDNGEGLVLAGVMRELCKTLLVSLALGATGGLIVCRELPQLLMTEFAQPVQIRGVFAASAARLWFSLVGVLLLAGAFEFFNARQRRRKRLMMDAEEMKREFKESEGSPELRQARRQLYKEIVMHGIVQGVRRAKVLVVSHLSR